MSDTEDFDPFQVFEVEHRECLILHIKVLVGRNISKGSWMADLVDTPDPYMLLRLKNAPDGRKRTRSIDNEVNPEWNENFTFLLDSQFENIISITLMDANTLCPDEVIGSTSLNINQLTTDQTERHTFIFNDKSEVDMEIKIEWDKNPSLRFSLCLCGEEKRFRRMRRQRVFKTLKDMLQTKGPHGPKEVPTIGVLGSGGGFRAMVGMSGAMKALWDSGILNSVMYIASLSGSSWYLSQLYSHPQWPNFSPGDQMQELKFNIDSSLLWLLKPSSLFTYLDRIMHKRLDGQPVSFTDFFGLLVGETLLKDRMHVRLSDQHRVLEEAQVPMPLYTCVHVKKDVSAKVFQEWVEFTPFEIGMPKYGTFMKAHQFGNKFFLGKLLREHAEQPLHFLQGVWGSAFCILFKRLLNDTQNKDPVDLVRAEMGRELDVNSDATSSDSSASEDESDAAVHQRARVKRRRLSKTRERNVPQLRKQSSRQKGFWEGFLNSMFNSSNFSLLSSRAGRAGVIHNPLRGLALHRSYPISPFTPMPTVATKDEFDGNFELHPTNVKKLYIVDAGLTFNSPYPLLLRPQRSVDILISFDFSARPGDSAPPFKELLLAEKWAKLNGVNFPPIDTSVFEREGMKEMYIFKHPTDPHCPVVLHFVLINRLFREYKKPGVKRVTKEEFEFANFDIFDDPNTPYSTFNFKYPHKAFDQLSQLTEFNTLLHIEDIKQVIEKKIQEKRTKGERIPIQSSKVPLLKIKTLENSAKLQLYLKRLESGSSTGPVVPDDAPKSADSVSTESGELFLSCPSQINTNNDSSETFFTARCDKTAVVTGENLFDKGFREINERKS